MRYLKFAPICYPIVLSDDGIKTFGKIFGTK